MSIDKNSAAVDNDFINKVAQIRTGTMSPEDMLREIFSALQIHGIMHPLVYEKELLKEAPGIKAIFDKNVVEYVSFDDIFQGDEGKRAYYMFLVPELYNALMGKKFPEDKDVFTFWIRQNSLGEIHSVSMCLVSECAVFLSDDGDSKALKNIVNQRAMGAIEVFNRNEIVEKYQASGVMDLNVRTARHLRIRADLLEGRMVNHEYTQLRRAADS